MVVLIRCHSKTKIRNTNSNYLHSHSVGGLSYSVGALWKWNCYTCKHNQKHILFLLKVNHFPSQCHNLFN